MSIEITDEASLKAHLASEEPVWLIKHSITCGISDAAYGEYNGYLAAHPEAKAAHILIQKQRPLSNLTADLLGRVHQSSTDILSENGEVLWTATHWSITAAAMDAAYKEASAAWMMSSLPAPHLIYCHGFASGPECTSKGKALREHLATELSSLHIPDLQGERFFDLSINGMRQRLLDCVAALPDDGAPLILAGSSLGAWLSAWVAAEAAVPRCAGLILVAPAFGFVSRWADILGEAGVADWRANGKRSFFHYRSESEQDLGVGFLDSCEHAGYAGGHLTANGDHPRQT